MAEAESAALAWLQQAQLPCGADVGDLLEQASDGRADELTDHQAGCVHCQAALREFSRIWEPVRSQAAEIIPVPRGLTSAVQDRVRMLMADVWYSLQLTDSGQVRVAARVVANLARAAARTVPGVRVAFGRSSTSATPRVVESATLSHSHPHAAVGVSGRTAVLDIALAVHYGRPIDTIAREVQRRVITELRANVGLMDVTVNVTVDDVLT